MHCVRQDCYVIGGDGDWGWMDCRLRIEVDSPPATYGVTSGLSLVDHSHRCRERESFIDNLLVRIHLIIEMI